ncbi:hypothetical protein K440DRAFT_641221 [Wilcoxina mikolae CBS 423.85]|nr:hypothetical protein K440DRAFT_641221 [Wilcoxina mikolae CBS 423.85]
MWPDRKHCYVTGRGRAFQMEVLLRESDQTAGLAGVVCVRGRTLVAIQGTENGEDGAVELGGVEGVVLPAPGEKDGAIGAKGGVGLPEAKAVTVAWSGGTVGGVGNIDGDVVLEGGDDAAKKHRDVPGCVARVRVAATMRSADIVAENIEEDVKLGCLLLGLEDAGVAAAGEIGRVCRVAISRAAPNTITNMKRPASYPTTSSRNKKRKRMPPIDPFHWNRNHLAAVGATINFGLDLHPSRHHPTCGTRSRPRPVPRPGRSSVTPIMSARSSSKPSPKPHSISPRSSPHHRIRNSAIRCPVYPLSQRYQDKTVWWRARGCVGSRLWLVEPRRCGADFAEEAAFVLSLAQEFIAVEEEEEEEEDEFEVWLVSVRAGKTAVVKATVARTLLHALEENRVVEAGKLIGPNRALRMEVSKEFRITDEEDRVAFVGVLAGLAQVENVVRAGEEVDVEAASWSW